MSKNAFSYFSLILILRLISGCVAKSNSVNVQSRNTESPTPVFVPTNTIQSMVQPITTKQSGIRNIEPKIEKYCPPQPEVSIDKLGLPSNLVLVAVDGNQNLGDINQPLHSYILSFSGLSSLPNKIADITSVNSDLVVGVSLSPTGRLMDVLRWQSGNSQISLWVRTSDGRKEWKVTDISVRQRVFWVSDEEIVVSGVPNEDNYERIFEQDMMPLLSINPFTLEIRSLSLLPQGSIYEYGSYHSSKDGNSYSVYYNKDDPKQTRFLYDYSSRTSTPIFPWIDFSNPSTGIGISPNGFYEVAQREDDGVNFALGFTREQAISDNNYNQFMNHLLLRTSQDLVISLMIGMTRSDILILTSPANSSDTQKTTPVFLYNPQANILKDYCLEFARSSVYVKFSPDERFLALTIADFLDDRQVYHLLVINLQNGYYTVIKDTKAIGFAVVQ